MLLVFRSERSFRALLFLCCCVKPRVIGETIDLAPTDDSGTATAVGRSASGPMGRRVFVAVSTSCKPTASKGNQHKRRNNIDIMFSCFIAIVNLFCDMKHHRRSCVPVLCWKLFLLFTRRTKNKRSAVSCDCFVPEEARRRGRRGGE